MTNENRSLDERFFEWMAAEVDIHRTSNPERSYWMLLEQMYQTPFRAVLHRDLNRIEDGYALRHEWVYQHGLGEETIDWMEMDISVLEMLVALSRHLSYKTGWSMGRWFWEMLGNLGMRQFSDAEYLDGCEEMVAVILEDFIDRRYSSTGGGGPFPLKDARSDQRGVEIWYQMNAYLTEDMDRFF